ncbi:MAG: periplasmic heavy metal sensor [Tenuifilaceae bacterium]|nr:periplasmic heavy metal sensor [Tenuifilaceae bacterium]
MNATTKNRLIIGTLVLSVAINLAIVGTMWFYKPKPAPNAPLQSEIRRTRANHSQMIANNLKFSAEQEELFEKMRADYAEQTRNIKIALKDHYSLIMSELRSNEPQRELLDSLAHEIGRLHIEQQQATITHFITLREVCSPEQYDQLLRMFTRGMQNGQRKFELEQRRLHQNRSNNRRNRRVNE